MRADLFAQLLTPLPLGSADETGRIPLPASLVITPWGESRDLSGAPVIVNDKTAAVLAANQAKLGRTEVALDFEHNTWDKTKPEPKPVAAYGTLSVETGVGIIWTPLADSWTPEGSNYYTGKHYRDISPTVYRDKDGVVIALHSVALTRAGQIADLKSYALSATADLVALSSDLTENNTMDYAALLSKLLGISVDDLATMSEEDVVAKITALGTKTETETETEAAPMSAEARLDLLEKRQLISDAKLAGKIIPLSSEAMESLPLSSVQTILSGLEAGKVPTTAATKAGELETGPKPLSAEEREVCKQLGLTEDQFRKSQA